MLCSSQLVCVAVSVTTKAILMMIQSDWTFDGSPDNVNKCDGEQSERLRHVGSEKRVFLQVNVDLMLHYTF